MPSAQDGGEQGQSAEGGRCYRRRDEADPRGYDETEDEKHDPDERAPECGDTADRQCVRGGHQGGKGMLAEHRSMDPDGRDHGIVDTTDRATVTR